MDTACIIGGAARGRKRDEIAKDSARRAVPERPARRHSSVRYMDLILTPFRAQARLRDSIPRMQ
jgi:hypothetical protein